MGSLEKILNLNSKYNGLSIDQALGAVGGHEFVHGTDIGEISKDIKSEINNRGGMRTANVREAKPTDVVDQIINELNYH